MKEIIRTGKMVSGRALSLLIKRSSNLGATSVPRSEGVEVIDPNDLEGAALDTSINTRDKKRSRQEKESQHSKKPLHGTKNNETLQLEKVLTAGKSLPNVSLDSEVIRERPGSIMIEISPEARWNLGDQQPLQAFGAFRLDRDASSYEGFSRGEIAQRSRRRLGMFISDFERLEEAGAAREREVSILKTGLSEANQKLCDLTGREDEAARKLAAEEKLRSDEKAKFKKQVAALEEEMGRFRHNCDLLQRERDEVKASNIALVKEVDSLKKALADSDDELIRSLAGGYNACLDRLVVAGVDGSGHSFEDYCADLRAEQADKEDDTTSKAGNAP